MNETAVILVHYGDADVTARCLGALAGQDSRPFVIVSNNGDLAEAETLRDHASALWSPDEVRMIRPGDSVPEDAPFPTVTIVHNAENQGYAAGCNAGIRLARMCSSIRYVWLLNNDTIPAPDALAALLCEAGTRRGTLLGGTMVDDVTGRVQLAGGAQYDPCTTMLTPCHEGAPLSAVENLDEPVLDYVYGASLFAPMALFREIGLLDEIFFLFYEELDLCRRAQKAGYALGWCRECVVRHAVSASVGRPSEQTMEQARTAAYHEARSTILFTRKHHIWLLPVALVARTVGKLATLVSRGEWVLAGPALSGLADGLFAPLE